MSFVGKKIDSPRATFAHKRKSSAGFTLVEALIYIALFVMIIGGGMVSAYQIIEGTRRIDAKTTMEGEANFLARKLDWALSGSVVLEPLAGAEGNTLRLGAGGTNIEITTDGSGVATIDTGAGAVPLTSERVRVSGMLFRHIPASGARPPALEYSFTMGDQRFATSTRYTRAP